MKKVLIILICLLFVLCFYPAADQDANSQIRRLFLDLLNRTPTTAEFISAEAELGLQDGYRALVDKLIESEEFKETLSWHIVRHYSPGINPKTVIPLLRTRDFLKKKYLKDNKDFRLVLRDIITATGAEVFNPMVRFYSEEDTPETIIARITKRMVAIPYGCAKCHDHKYYSELVQKEFWELTAFLESTKIQKISPLTNPDIIHRKVYSEDGGNNLGPQMSNFNLWLRNERRKIDSYNLVKHAITRQITADPIPNGLGSPQMVISEERKFAWQMRIDYKTPDNRKIRGRATLPFSVPFSKNFIFPRYEIARWLYSSDVEPFLNRSITNWVMNWLMGSGVKASIEDTFDITDEQEVIFNKYTGLLKKVNYRLEDFVREIVLSDEYRKDITGKKVKGIYKSRNLRYLSGRQIVNILHG